MKPMLPFPFANTTVPEWLIVIVALLTAAACGAVDVQALLARRMLGI